jgi:hypothetical protein
MVARAHFAGDGDRCRRRRQTEAVLLCAAPGPGTEAVPDIVLGFRHSNTTRGVDRPFLAFYGSADAKIVVCHRCHVNPVHI